MTDTAPRVLSADVHAHALTPGDDTPQTAIARLDTLGAASIGIWSIETGVAHDTEADEVFVVLSGRGRVDFEDGSSVDLAPGAAIRLHAGERTTWTITEPLRKVYIAL